MNHQEMQSLLAVYLDDPNGEMYAPSMLSTLLNLAQDNAVLELRWDLTPEINLIATAKAISQTNGSFNYVTGLSASPPLFRDRGIVAVRLTDGNFCRRRSFRESMEDYNVGRQFGAENPIFWAYGDSINVTPFLDHTIDIYYRRHPIRMAEGVSVENFLSLTQTGTPSTTQFTGDSGQSLSAVDDAYNGMAIYCPNTGTSHVITDYTGSTRLFTVTPALAGAARFLTGYTFRFLMADEDTGDTDCELDPVIHDVIVQWAAGIGYQRPLPTISGDWSRFNQRKAKGQEFIGNAMAEIYRLNQRFPATDSVGPNADLGDDDTGFRINMNPALLG